MVRLSNLLTSNYFRSFTFYSFWPSKFHLMSNFPHLFYTHKSNWSVSSGNACLNNLHVNEMFRILSEILSAWVLPLWLCLFLTFKWVKRPACKPFTIVFVVVFANFLYVSVFFVRRGNKNINICDSPFTVVCSSFN